jgi:hypothetical protein
MELARWKTIAGACFLAAVLSVPAWSDTDNRQAVPGTLNYLEGQASIGDQTLDSKSIGAAELGNGQTLETKNGKAEILLTPGVYLRLGSNSSAKMVSNSLTNTQVMLNSGEAMLEVDELYKENNIRISQPGADTLIVKTGLYDFDAADHAVRVFDGKAVVAANDHETTLKKNRELALNNADVKATEFNKKATIQGDDLYRWSSLRSQYLSEANVATAQLYFVNGWYGPGWWGPGWYWNPWFAGFTFLPGNGFFYSPFGWGFYSPLVVRSAPVVIGGGYHHFDGARPMAIGHGFNDNAVTAMRAEPGGMGGFQGEEMPTRGLPSGGFHGGGMRTGGFAGSGFHGGAVGGHR